MLFFNEMCWYHIIDDFFIRFLNFFKSICIRQCKIEKWFNFIHLIPKITHASQDKNV